MAEKTPADNKPTPAAPAAEKAKALPAGYVKLKKPLVLSEHFEGEICQFSGQQIKDQATEIPEALAKAWGLETA